MANKIQFKRGTKENLPTLSVGEPGFCTDTKELFIGASEGNVQIVDQAQFAAHLSETMPHKFTDGTTTYRWGLAVINGAINMVYEEVV